jgi:hypothetical protein
LSPLGWVASISGTSLPSGPVIPKRVVQEETPSEPGKWIYGLVYDLVWFKRRFTCKHEEIDCRMGRHLRRDITIL